MCHATRCRTCGKTTWAGCGRHIARVRAGVPAGQWCPGHDADPTPPAGTWLNQLLRRAGATR